MLTAFVPATCQSLSRVVSRAAVFQSTRLAPALGAQPAPASLLRADELCRGSATLCRACRCLQHPDFSKSPSSRAHKFPGTQAAPHLKGHRNSFHGHHVEAGVAKITCCDIVDAVDEISHANELLNVQRPQGLDLSLRRSDHRSFVPGFPFFNNLVFTLVPVNHKWRSTFGVDWKR